jgi:predicted Rdx family selenoprotein
MEIHKLENGKSFRFEGDVDKVVYWKRKCDGMYAQVFATKKDMEDFTDPAYIDCSTKVVEA